MRVLILSDIHANLVALEAVLAAAREQYDTIWCLGDVIGYGPRPNECVELVRERVQLCVLGNHDWAGIDRPGVRVRDFNPQARDAILWTRNELNSENLRYLDNLSDHPMHPLDDDTLLMTHASPREPVWEYILTPKVAMENFLSFNEQICLVGHTHKPIVYHWQLHEMEHDPALNGRHPTDQAGEALPIEPRYRATVDALMPKPGTALQLDTSPSQRLILNPGSVGQPRDNDPDAAYAILDTEKFTWAYERVPYDIGATQRQMREAGLPQRLIERLNYGW